MATSERLRDAMGMLTIILRACGWWRSSEHVMGMWCACLWVVSMMCMRAVAGDGGDESRVVAPGQIATGGEVRSANGRYLLCMQYDCNLVLYDVGKKRLPLWATNTSGHGANCYAAMQSNGDFVLYDGAHVVKFQTFTFIYSCTGDFFAWVQDDGNFVVYCAPFPGQFRRQLTALWASGTDGWPRA